MNAKFTGEMMIFKNKYGYSTGVSRKNIDGTYENSFFPVQFKKGVEVEHKTKINATNAFLTFYKNKDNQDVHYIMITDFTQVGDAAEDTATAFDNNDLPF